MVLGWFTRGGRKDAVQRLYECVADASRRPDLYLHAAVPDTVEGRLESLTIHTLLVARALARLPAPAPDLAQDLTDRVFTHIDHGLRELGVGDIVVPKRMKKIAQSHLGRVHAYSPALDAADDVALAEALARNVTAGADASRLAQYMLAAETHLATLSYAQIEGSVDLFPALPFRPHAA